LSALKANLESIARQIKMSNLEPFDTAWFSPTHIESEDPNIDFGKAL
jgi:hypothetical protein